MMSGAQLPVPIARAAAAKRPLRLLPEVQDRAFLAAALEIVETPPSPIRINLMLSICALATGALVWSWFGHIDIHATARGKIEPAGHAKVVQPLEPGQVAAVHVTEGQWVHTGEVLLELDSREVQAQLAAAESGWTAAEAEALRRRAEIAAAGRDPVGLPGTIPWPAEIPPATRVREEQVLRGDLGELAATLANLDDQLAEKTAAVRQLDMSIAAETAMIQPLTERVELRRTLFSEKNGSKLNLLDAVQSLMETQTQLAGDTGRRDQALAAIASLKSERRRSIDAFLADTTRKLADAQRTADEKRQDRAKALAELDRMRLVAPVDGAVQGLSITNRGQVVTVGQEVMRLVPLGGPLEVQAYVSNQDIGFVVPGQSAVVKIDSFPFTRYGTIAAEVISVARDAIPGDAASAAMADAAKPVDRSSQNLAPAANGTDNLVFAAQLRPVAQSLMVDGREVPLTAGMTVTVEIKTGSRRVLDFVLSPLAELIGNSMGER